MRLPRPLLALSLIALTTGCGYRMLGGGTGPVAQVDVGQVDDLSAEGDLGVRVSGSLQQQLAGRDRPRLTHGAPRLTGRVRALPDVATGYGDDGLTAAWRTGVELELRLEAGDRVLWESGPTRAHALFLRANAPVETRAARRDALRTAARQAAVDALQRFLATTRIEEPPT